MANVGGLAVVSCEECIGCVVQIFMKVDTNCDGTVDWNEYLTFMLLEEQHKQAMNFNAERRCLPSKLVRRVKPGRKSPSYDHSDDVVRIVFQPTSHRDGNVYRVGYKCVLQP